MKVSELFEARAPFKKGDQVVTKNAQKLRGKVALVNKAYEYVLVKTDDGHEFNADFNQIELDTKGAKASKKLSPRDQEIMDLLKNGQSPEEVAAVMRMRVNQVLDVQGLNEEASVGTLSVSPSGDGFVVNASSKTGPIIGAVYWVWKTLSTKKGVTVKMKSGRTVEKNDGFKLFDNRPQGLVFFGVDEETVKAAAEAAVARTEKEVKAAAKHKADAPKRRAEASKFNAELRKKDLEEYAKLYGKGTWNRVTYRQEGGDDGYQYVVRVDGRSIMNGLTRRSAEHEKRQQVDAIAKREKLGKYAEKK